MQEITKSKVEGNLYLSNVFLNSGHGKDSNKSTKHDLFPVCVKMENEK